MRILKPENVNRRIDNLGRITLPKGLRKRMLLEEDCELELFTAFLENRECIVLSKPLSEKVQKRMAVETLIEAGFEITDEMAALLEDEDDEDED